MEESFKFSQEFYEVVKTKRSDSLFDILVTFQNKNVCSFLLLFGLSHLQSQSQIKQLVLTIGMQISELLCAGYLSGQGLSFVSFPFAVLTTRRRLRHAGHHIRVPLHSASRQVRSVQARP
jgi:hypothetical protein